MIDVVIPLGWGSIWDNQEIKYSLRSFERHLKGIRNIFVVTDLSGMPNFLNNVIHLPCPDDTNIKAINTFKKILKACQDKRVSENFILSNDDFFLNQDFDGDSFPYFHRGEIMRNWDNLKDKRSHYPTSRKITDAVLRKKGFPSLHYGIHCPMMINKTKFIAMSKLFPFERSKGYLTRCIYGNVFGVGGEQRKDVKINGKLPAWKIKKIVDQFEFYSIGERATGPELHKFFERKYPNPSQWEKQS
jgi:hypothetical protein